MAGLAIFCRAASRLIFRPSASPAQPSRSASPIRAIELLQMSSSRAR
jgi:hypothetical protein